MPYMVKATAAAGTALTAALVVGLTLAGLLAFNLFGAYMPDGFSITGYAYGLSDAELMIMAAVSTISGLAVMIAILTKADSHL